MATFKKWTSTVLVNGQPEPNVEVHVYEPGTTNEITVYEDEGVTPITQPILTDSQGRYAFFVDVDTYPEIRLYLEKDGVDFSEANEDLDGVPVPGAGAGAGTFLELSDTPSSYVGRGGDVVLVKTTEDGIETQPWPVTGTILNFFLSDDAADIGSYYYMYPTESGNGYSELTSPSLSTGDDQLLWAFVTEAGEPGVEVLALGAYTTTLFLKKTGNKDVRVYWKLFKRDTGGTETEILQSAVSDYLTADNSQYLISAYLNEDQVLDPTDRLVLKLYANVSGTGTDVTVTLTMEGDYDSRLTINVLSSAFNLDRLSDVTISSPSNDELLAYDSGSGKWINQTASEAGLLTADAGKGCYNVSAYGAKGDGTTDDTTAIQNAINAATAAGGGTVVFPYPSNYYRVSSKITLDSNITLLGLGDRPLIYNDGDTAEPIFEAVGTPSSRKSDIKIENLSIRNGTASTGDYTSGKNGLFFDYVDGITISNCKIYEIQGPFGLWIRRSSNIRVVGNEFDRPTYSAFTLDVETENIWVERNVFSNPVSTTSSNVYLFMTGGNPTEAQGEWAVRNLWVVNNRFYNNTRWEGIDTHGGENIWILNNYIENCRIGIMVGTSKDLFSSTPLSTKNVHIKHNVIIRGNGETNHTGISVQGAYGTGYWLPAQHIEIEDNYIEGYGSSASDTVGAISVNTVEDLVIRHNYIKNIRGDGILLYHTVRRGAIEDNIIEDAEAQDSADRSYGIYLRSIGTFDVFIKGNLVRYTDPNTAIKYGIRVFSASTYTRIEKNKFSVSTSAYFDTAYLPVLKSTTPSGLFARPGDIATNTDDLPAYGCTGGPDTPIRKASGDSGVTVDGTAGSNELTIASGDFRYIPEDCEIVIVGAGSGGADLTTTTLKVTNEKIWIKDNLGTTVSGATVNFTDAAWSTLP